jgi:hypothetical protein
VVDVGRIVFDKPWEQHSASVDGPASGCTDEDEDVTDDEDAPGRDLSFVMPSRVSVARYLEDASMLNLKNLAETLMEKDTDTVVTCGIDDTKKAAGHKVHDVKTDCITFGRADGTTQSYTTGFLENASRSGR